MNSSYNISVIVPLGPGEDVWKQLVHDLTLLPESAEIIFVFSDANNSQSRPYIKYSGNADEVPLESLPFIFSNEVGRTRIRRLGKRRLMLVHSPSGRAHQMNAGSELASSDFLWFLHADSHFTSKSLEILKTLLARYPDGLYFFRLTFMDDGGTALTGISQWAARIRSEIFKVPFGDQGFCLSKENFERIGGYPEDVEYGEDHLFIWYARQKGIQLICTGQELFTSARKYKTVGWGKLTLLYQYRWLKQAAPEYLKLLLNRSKS